MVNFRPFTVNALAMWSVLPILRSTCMRLLTRRTIITALSCCFLSAVAPSLFAEKSWTKLRYQAGTIAIKVNPFDWNTTMTVTGHAIKLNFESRKMVVIRSEDILSLTYGMMAYRSVSALLSGGGDVQPVPLFGILRNDKDHLIGLIFRAPDGSRGAFLLMAHKSNYHEILGTLSEVTGKPVEGIP